MSLKVSELAGRAGVSAHTIRYYEKEGLLPEPSRSASGYREFDEALIDRLRFIKGAQSFGLRLAEIRELLDIHDKGACPCGHTKVLVDRRMQELDEEIARLRQVRAALQRLSLLECPNDAMARWLCSSESREGGESDDRPDPL